MVKVTALAALLLPALVLAASPVPRIQRPVTDTVGLLSPAEEESVATELVRLREDTGVQLAVLVVGTTAPEPLEDFSMRVVEAWRGGEAGNDDGLLFTLVVNDRRMRLEVGYGLEADLPDDAVRRLLDAQLPLLRQQRYPDAMLGVIAGVRERVKWRGDGRVAERRAGGGRVSGVPEAPSGSSFFVGPLGFLVLCVLGGLMGTVLAFLWSRWLKESGLARVGITGALVFGVPWGVTVLGEGGPYPVSHFVWVLLLTALVACLAAYIFLEASRRAGLFLAGAPVVGIVLALLIFDDARPLALLSNAIMMTGGAGIAALFVGAFFSGSGSSSSYRSSGRSSSYSSSSDSSGSSWFSSSSSGSSLFSSSSSDSSWSSSSSSDSSWSSSSSDSHSSSSSDDYRGGGGDFGGGGASSSW